MRIIIKSTEGKDVEFQDHQTKGYKPLKESTIPGHKRELVENFVTMTVGKTVLTFKADELFRTIEALTDGGLLSGL